MMTIEELKRKRQGGGVILRKVTKCAVWVNKRHTVTQLLFAVSDVALSMAEMPGLDSLHPIKKNSTKLSFFLSYTNQDKSRSAWG